MSTAGQMCVIEIGVLSSPTQTPSHVLETAVAIARQAGAILLEGWGEAGPADYKSKNHLPASSRPYLPQSSAVWSQQERQQENKRTHQHDRRPRGHA